MTNFNPRFLKELRRIISQGDCEPEYRDLFKKIVEIHRQEFTEENIPTTHGYLQELLDDAIEVTKEKEDLDMIIHDHERELNDLRKRKALIC